MFLRGPARSSLPRSFRRALISSVRRDYATRLSTTPALPNAGRASSAAAAQAPEPSVPGVEYVDVPDGTLAYGPMVHDGSGAPVKPVVTRATARLLGGRGRPPCPPPSAV